MVSSLTSHTLGQHAIVLGGSIAGLFSARILSDYFDHVTLIERDVYSETPELRKGVPQAQHAHALMGRGYNVMADFMPSIADDLANNGALTMDTGLQVRAFNFGAWGKTFEGGVSGIVASRALLDWTVHCAVQQLPNVTIKDGHEVVSLMTTEDKARVTGVNVRAKSEAAMSEALEADLVLDTTGRGSQLPKWLEALGYQRPDESSVKIDVAYTSREYTRHTKNGEVPMITVINSTPPQHKRLVVLFPLENDRWHITMGGFCGDHAPADEEGFQAFARSLPAPDAIHLITTETPLTDIVQYKFGADVRRHYEKMSLFPEGVLVLGDAVCSFNPVYGQGMSIAALEIEALHKLLAEQSTLDGIAPLFFKRITPIVDDAWAMATGGDYRFPEVEGKRPASANFMNGYLEWLTRAGHEDPEVNRAFNKVQHMMAPAPSLFAPPVAFRVARYWWRNRNKVAST